MAYFHRATALFVYPTVGRTSKTGYNDNNSTTYVNNDCPSSFMLSENPFTVVLSSSLPSRMKGKIVGNLFTQNCFHSPIVVFSKYRIVFANTMGC